MPSSHGSTATSATMTRWLSRPTACPPSLWCRCASTCGTYVALSLIALTQTQAQAIDRKKLDVKPPPMASKLSWPASYLVNFPLCTAGSALLKLAAVERRLTNGETWRLLGSCALPLVGGYVVEKAFSQTKAWKEYPIDINGPGVPAWRRRD